MTGFPARPPVGPVAVSDADLRAAAFGDRPDADVHAMAADGAPRQRWLAAVTLGGQGRYGLATAVLRGLLADADPVLAALAGATLASHRRQLGGHAAARSLDGAAAGRLAGVAADGHADPDGLDAAGAWSDVLLGLAADAVGLGRVGEARRLHSVAADTADRVSPSWRTRVRIGWVAAEIELLAGHPERAIGHAEQAAELATAAGSVRHEIKSRLVLAAALAAGGNPGGRRRAAGLLTEALAASLRWGILTLTWPCALLLADLAPDQADNATMIARASLTWVFTLADREVQHLAVASPWVPTALVRSGEPTRTGSGRSS